MNGIDIKLVYTYRKTIKKINNKNKWFLGWWVSGSTVLIISV